MPIKYVIQMIIDWQAMGRKFGDTAEEYYRKNGDNFILHSLTKKRIEKILKQIKINKDIKRILEE